MTFRFFCLISMCCISLSGWCLPLRLEERLEAEQNRRLSARNVLLERLQDSSKPLAEQILTRDQWETLLQPPAADLWSSLDLDILRAEQRERASRAWLKSRAASILDLDEIRKTRTEKEFCSQLPKGGMLHIHPAGTLNRTLARQLVEKSNPQLEMGPLLEDIHSPGSEAFLEPDETEWLRKIPAKTPFLNLPVADQSLFLNFLFLPPGKHSFPRFNAVFHFLDFAVPDWESFHQVMLDFAKRAVREHVSYVEFTTGSNARLFEKVRSIQEETGLVIRINHSFQRTASLEELQKRWQELQLRPEKDPLLVGIDFLDNEEGHAAFEKGQWIYGKALASAQSGEFVLHRTQHAGEIGDIRNPRDAMILGAERLGHGVNLRKDPVTLELASRQKLPIEINLSSNLRLSDIESLQEHPFLHYLRLGLPVSLSTDDEGIFETDINRECELAVRHTNVTYDELKKMAFFSIETSFAPPELKSKLRSQLEHSFQRFEQQQIRFQNRPAKPSRPTHPAFSHFLESSRDRRPAA